MIIYHFAYMVYARNRKKQFLSINLKDPKNNHIFGNPHEEHKGRCIPKCRFVVCLKSYLRTKLLDRFARSAMVPIKSAMTLNIRV
jgi:hypothetical protein